MPNSEPVSIAVFVTPHGFGHATRQIAVMSAWLTRRDDLCFHLYTRVPESLFAELLHGHFVYHELETDVGLVQKTSLEEDVAASVKKLDGFYPLDGAVLERVAADVRRQGCRLVVCDIAPMGIAVADRAGVPSVLVENFTWDWIYAGYLGEAPGLKRHIELLSDLFTAATHRIQTRPVCEPVPGCVTTGPVFRAARLSREETRRRIGIPDDASMVLLTLGGGGGDWNLDAEMREHAERVFVLAAQPGPLRREGNMIHLPMHSDLFHPDLVRAADCVIGKLGYSTVSEVFQAGVPFGYVTRPNFRESGPVGTFVRDTMPSIPIASDDYASGRWLGDLDDVLALERVPPPKENGADAVVDFLEGLLP